MKHEEIPISKIKIGNRQRMDAGDIEGLAANIAELGLLQPIGVDRYYQLIFGGRRLEACQIHLKWKKIPAVILDIDSVLAGEYAENEFRKQFTPSERAKIGEAIERELGNRKGVNLRSVVGAIAATGRTVTLAAQRAGFKSAETFKRAKAVVAKGVPELRAAMDSGKVSIDAAAKIASQPKDEQKRIVAMPREDQREIVNRIRKTKADKEKDERRAFDIRVFRGLAEAVEIISHFAVSGKETWEGLTRVSAFRFSEDLERAINCLVRLQRDQPNAPRRPGLVTKKAT